MDLYNCKTEQEKTLKEIELIGLSDYELKNLGNKVHEAFREGVLEDEVIITDALYQIIDEALERLATEKAVPDKIIEIGLGTDA